MDDNLLQEWLKSGNDQMINKMIEEVEMKLDGAIHDEFENSTLDQPIKETTLDVLGQYEQTSESMKNVFEMQDDKVTLPVANPYIAAYLILIVSAAVISNCVVLTVMGVHRRKLRTFQLCLVSVCVSDLLFSLLLHPMSIATALGYDAHRIFNHSGCLYFGVLALFFGSYDMVIHSLIAVLRYINLCHPAQIEWFTKRTVLILFIICVFYSAIWCIGPLFGIGKYVTFEVGCTMAFSDTTLSGRTFVNCAFIFVFFIPLTVTISSYVAIILEVGKQRRNLERIGTVSAVGSNRLAVEMKLVRLTSIIAAAYIIVWLPYAIVCLAEAYGDAQSIPWIFRILAALFCKTGTATNPVIYLFMSKGFRRETVETIRILLCSKVRRFSVNLLHSSSQKSSSYRSTSQVSLRSSLYNRFRKDQSSLQRKSQSSTKKNTNEQVSSSHQETSV